MTGIKNATAKSYLNARENQSSTFGYGLQRRTQMVLSKIRQHSGTEPIDAIDFACADSFMLAALKDHFPNFRSGIGIDVFRAGVPGPQEGLKFEEIDLFKKLDQVQAWNANIAIVSSFIKHHPDPVQFLLAVRRSLREGGIVILLDPRPVVVHAAALTGRFNKAYIPSLWDKTTLSRWLEQGRLREQLQLESFELYWKAPIPSLERAEFLLPAACSLHQCAVLRAWGNGIAEITPSTAAGQVVQI